MTRVPGDFLQPDFVLKGLVVLRVRGYPIEPATGYTHRGLADRTVTGSVRISENRENGVRRKLDFLLLGRCSGCG
jgi:hypothetical protein